MLWILDYIPYIHNELHYTPLEEFFQSKLENKGVSGIGTI
jgi:hypothetical protein